MKNKIEAKTVMWAIGIIIALAGSHMANRISSAEDIAVLKEQNRHSVRPESVATISADYKALLNVNKLIFVEMQNTNKKLDNLSTTQNRMIGALNAQGIKVSSKLKNSGMW